MEIIAVSQPIEHGTAELNVGHLVGLLGPEGVAVLLAVGAVLLLRYKPVRSLARKALKRAARALLRFVRIVVWAAYLRMPLRLAYRLQPERWRNMCQDRRLVGLKRGRVKRTAQGVDVLVTLNGALRLDTLVTRIPDLETGLGVRRGSIRVEGRESAHKALIRITVRNPLARPIPWSRPAGPVSIADPVHLAVTPFGDAMELDLRQRILIVGASGAGKSSVQRVLSAPVILAEDADLEVWDLKQGSESQHYEGKAVRRITTAAECAARIEELVRVELPRRAAILKARKSSTWKPTATDRDLVVMVDEGASLIRELDDEHLNMLFTFLEQARAFGVFLWWATQFPKATNLPTELRSQMSCLVALKMRRASESKLVFEDLAREGWTPHRLPGPGWLMVLDDDHQEPDQARALWLSEKVFRSLPSTTAAPAAPAAPSQPVQDAVPDVVPEDAVPVPEDAVPAPHAVLRFLATAPADGVSVAAIRAATGLSQTVAYDTLSDLVASGSVVKVRHGRYATAVEVSA